MMRKLKIIALALLAIPIASVTIFFVGETVTAGLAVSFQHAVELVPLLLLAVLGWWRPLIAGTVLAGLGTLIAVAYLMPALLAGTFPPAAAVIVEPVLLLPVVAGILLIIHARRSPRPDSGTPRAGSGRPA